MKKKEKEILEFALLLKGGWIWCGDFKMADKMFKRINSASMLLVLNPVSGESMVYKTR